MKCNNPDQMCAEECIKADRDKGTFYRCPHLVLSDEPETELYYEPKYCECCGRLKSEIMRQLDDVPFIDGWKTVNGHKQSEGMEHFHSLHLTVNNCQECGGELQDDDFQTSTQTVGEYRGNPARETLLDGYKCSHCGHEMEV